MQVPLRPGTFQRGRRMKVRRKAIHRCSRYTLGVQRILAWHWMIKTDRVLQCIELFSHWSKDLPSQGSPTNIFSCAHQTSLSNPRLSVSFGISRWRYCGIYLVLGQLFSGASASHALLTFHRYSMAQCGAQIYGTPTSTNYLLSSRIMW